MNRFGTWLLEAPAVPSSHRNPASLCDSSVSVEGKTCERSWIVGSHVKNCVKNEENKHEADAELVHHLRTKKPNAT